VANTKTAKQQLKVSERNRLRNQHYQTVLKTALKRAKAALAEGGNKDEAQQAVSYAIKTLHRSATRRFIKRQNASRRASRLQRAFNRTFSAVEAAAAE
jgi:small subunit ribosomal protein S20